MSLLWRLLWDRAGHADLPDDIGPDPEPDEPEQPELPQPVLHLTDVDFAHAAAAINVPEAVIRAVAEVEAAGRGFLDDGRPQILYEAHVFHRLTGGRHAGARDRRGVALSVPRWDRTLYGRAGAAQHDRLEDAAGLDWDAAHRACSWGLFQIMGENHGQAGHPTIQGFVEAMREGASSHLDAVVLFIQANGLEGPLRRRDWATFARRYNGPGFASHKPPYDQRLAEAYRRFASS